MWFGLRSCTAFGHDIGTEIVLRCVVLWCVLALVFGFWLVVGAGVAVCLVPCRAGWCLVVGMVLNELL